MKTFMLTKCSSFWHRLNSKCFQLQKSILFTSKLLRMTSQNEEDLEVEIVPYGETVSHEWTLTVKSLDIMALGRVLNFITRQKFEFNDHATTPNAARSHHESSSKLHASSSPPYRECSFARDFSSSTNCEAQIKVEPFISQGGAHFESKFARRVHGVGKKFKATIEVSCAKGPRSIAATFCGVGIALNDKDAKIAAAMHIEMMLMHHEIPIFASSRLQHKYEEKHSRMSEIPSCVIFDSRHLPADRTLFTAFESSSSSGKESEEPRKVREEKYIPEGNILNRNSIYLSARPPSRSIVPTKKNSLMSPYIGDIQSLLRVHMLFWPHKKITSLKKCLRRLKKQAKLSKQSFGVYFRKEEAAYVLKRSHAEINATWNLVSQIIALCPGNRAMDAEEDVESLSEPSPMNEKLLHLKKVRLTSLSKEGTHPLVAEGFGTNAKDAFIAAAMSMEMMHSQKICTSEEGSVKSVCILPVHPPQMMLHGYFREISLLNAVDTEQLRTKSFILNLFIADEDPLARVLSRENSATRPFISSSAISSRMATLLNERYSGCFVLIGKSDRIMNYRVESCKEISFLNNKVHKLCGVGVASSISEAELLSKLHLFDQESYVRACSVSKPTCTENPNVRTFFDAKSSTKFYVYNPMCIDMYVKRLHLDHRSLRAHGPVSKKIEIDNNLIIPPLSHQPEGNKYSSCSSSVNLLDGHSVARTQKYYRKLGIDMRDFLQLFSNETTASRGVGQTVQSSRSSSLSLALSVKRFGGVFNLNLHQLSCRKLNSIAPRCGHNNYLAQCTVPLPLSEEVLLFLASANRSTSSEVKNNIQFPTKQSIDEFRRKDNASISLKSTLCPKTHMIYSTGIGHSRGEALQLMCMHADMLLHHFRVPFFTDASAELKRCTSFIRSNKEWSFYDTLDEYLGNHSSSKQQENLRLYSFTSESAEHPKKDIGRIDSPFPPLPLRFECSDSVRWMKYLQNEKRSFGDSTGTPDDVRSIPSQPVKPKSPEVGAAALRKLFSENKISKASYCRMMMASCVPGNGTAGPGSVSATGYLNAEQVRSITKNKADVNAMKRVYKWLERQGKIPSACIDTNFIYPLWHSTFKYYARGKWHEARGCSHIAHLANLALCIHLETLLLRHSTDYHNFLGSTLSRDKWSRFHPRSAHEYLPVHIVKASMY